MPKSTINKSAGRDHSPIRVNNENNINIKIANPEAKKTKRKFKPKHEPTLDEIDDALNNLEYSDQAITSQTAPSYGSGGSIQLPVYHNQNPYALMNQQTEASIYPYYNTLKFKPEYSKTIQDIPNNNSSGPIIEEIEDDANVKKRGRPPGSKNKPKSTVAPTPSPTYFESPTEVPNVFADLSQADENLSNIRNTIHDIKKLKEKYSKKDSAKQAVSKQFSSFQPSSTTSNQPTQDIKRPENAKKGEKQDKLKPVPWYQRNVQPVVTYTTQTIESSKRQSPHEL